MHIFIMGIDGSIIVQNCEDRMDYIMGLIFSCFYRLADIKLNDLWQGRWAYTCPRKIACSRGGWTNGWAVLKWLNRSRCHLEADACGLREQCISWVSTLVPPGEYE